MDIIVMTALSGIISLIISLFFQKTQSKKKRFFFYLITPVIVSFILYWIPASFQIFDEEYSAWSFLFIALSTCAGWIGESIGGIFSFVINRKKKV